LVCLGLFETQTGKLKCSTQAPESPLPDHEALFSW